MIAPINVRIGHFDAGCLVPLLTKEIAAVERELRVVGGRLTAEALEQSQLYLGQLRACLDAVVHARGAIA